MYKIIKSKRKTLCLSIKYDGEVIVRVPLHTSQIVIDEFVLKHKDWLNSKLDKINQVKSEHCIPKYFYLGNAYSLQYQKDFNDVHIDNGHFYTGFDREQLINWQKQQVRKIVKNFLDEYTLKFDLRYQQIKINSAKSRWGSCSINGNISFSYRVLMLPTNVIKYIVAHELSHLVHHNHSVEFWQHVAILYPDYKHAHDWLQKHKYQLSLAIN